MYAYSFGFHVNLSKELYINLTEVEYPFEKGYV